MNLSFYGSPLDQAAVGAALRTHEDDKNVAPAELVEYARSQGYAAELRVAGSSDLLRRLLSNGIPVLVETWYEPEGGPVSDDGLGHYRLLTGYEDAGQYWIAYDSLSYADLLPGDTYRGLRVPYADFDRYWQIFNRTYLLIYPPTQDAFVRGLLGTQADAGAQWPAAYADAQAAVAAAPDDASAWFNLGADALQVGNAGEAAAAFDRARELGLPPRLLWYEYAPLAAYYAAGRYADVLAVTDEVFVETESVEDVHYWRGMALAALGRAEEARAAWQRALELNPRFLPAQAALAGA
jgi:tetratricopeptide (TPR) repeat protein